VLLSRNVGRGDIEVVDEARERKRGERDDRVVQIPHQSSGREE
jgi:hypothetical protein